MANLIITVIAIALVAIASLMGAYYGGSAFLNNQQAANASTVLNQAQQISGAWNAYLSDNLDVPPAAGALVADLVTNGHYMAQIPSYPAGPSSASNTFGVSLVGTHYFAYADMGLATAASAGTVADPASQSCQRIIKTATGGTGALATKTAGNIYLNTAGGTGNGTFGCAYVAAAGTATVGGTAMPAASYVMEYLLQ